MEGMKMDSCTHRYMGAGGDGWCRAAGGFKPVEAAGDEEAAKFGSRRACPVDDVSDMNQQKASSTCRACHAR